MPEKTLLGSASTALSAICSRRTPATPRKCSPGSAAGIDVDALAATLQTEGAAAFVKSWDDMLACIGSKSDEVRTANKP